MYIKYICSALFWSKSAFYNYVLASVDSNLKDIYDVQQLKVIV